jgi:hypothetical protein
LRLWEELLQIDPVHAEALRRQKALSFR